MPAKGHPAATQPKLAMTSALRGLASMAAATAHDTHEATAELGSSAGACASVPAAEAETRMNTAAARGPAAHAVEDASHASDRDDMRTSRALRVRAREGG